MTPPRKPKKKASGATTTATARRGAAVVRTAETGKKATSKKSGVVRQSRAPKVGSVTVKPDAASLFDVPVEVERVVSALGSNTVADLLNVSRSQPSRWRAGKERISPGNRARLADLDHVLNRLLQVLWPEDASAWLTAPNPHLGGRPVDVLALHGAAPVIEAIDALAQGAYA
ncbi:MAG: antitoxin Xre/MbcA/ParS toxin-binding domain-containing protein [Acidimicrobiia bacterium]